MKRFWDKVDVRDPGECWEWKAALRSKHNPLQHYGVFWWRGRNYPAHRVAWELARGAALGDMLLCHRCDNPRCVNPGHLFPGTQRDNMLDKTAKLRQCGEKHGSARLTDDDVRQIRSLAACGIYKSAIGAAFGITGANVGHIVRRVTWRHVA